MRKLIETLINYGYLLREINDLLLISLYPETKTIKFSDNKLNMIANNIRKMNEKIKMLENGNSKEYNSKSED